MPDEIPQTNGQTENPLVRYERTDASFRWVMACIVAAAALGLVIFFGVWFFMEGYGAHQAKTKKSPFPLAPGPSESLPPEPRLEQLDHLAGNKGRRVYEWEAAKLGVLDSYGPTREEGYIHIPIDRAMDLLAGDKKLRETMLPSRPEPPAEQRRRSDGLVDAGASNSGRMFRGGAK
jgi:hypothetical protein